MARRKEAVGAVQAPLAQRLPLPLPLLQLPAERVSVGWQGLRLLQPLLHRHQHQHQHLLVTVMVSILRSQPLPPLPATMVGAVFTALPPDEGLLGWGGS